MRQKHDLTSDLGQQSWLDDGRPALQDVHNTRDLKVALPRFQVGASSGSTFKTCSLLFVACHGDFDQVADRLSVHECGSEDYNHPYQASVTRLCSRHGAFRNRSLHTIELTITVRRPSSVASHHTLILDPAGIGLATGHGA